MTTRSIKNCFKVFRSEYTGVPPAIPPVLRGRDCARTGWEGQAHTASRLRAFPLGRPRPWMSAAVILQYRNPKRKRHHESYFENEKGGCARADSEGTNNEGKDTRKPLTEIKH